MKRLGLYLHIPFCRSKCLYCDFCSLPRPDAETMAAYAEALCRELTAQSARCRAHEVDSIYFGGGTPTLLSARQLSALLETVLRHYRVSDDCEISAECNPATADAHKLRQLREAGFNRLSMGIQSAQSRELKALGRLHSFEDARQTWDAAVSAGFSNISADLMFGIPHQTMESFADTLEKLCALSPKHLSAYALTVEENTPFGRRGEAHLELPDEESVRQMYLMAVERLEQDGLCRYEISNFAKRGYESRHNLKYWNTEEYLGFGLAAHSDFDRERSAHGTDMVRYLAGEDITETRERPTPQDRLNEYIMLRMRLADGISVQAVAERFGEGAALALAQRLERYLKGGFVHRTESGFAFGSEGMLVSNAILSEILEL